MAFCALGLVRYFCGVGGNFSYYLARVSSVSAYRCGFFSTFNGDLPNLFRREDSYSIATAPANGEGHAVQAGVVATILRFRRGTNAISAKAQK